VQPSTDSRASEYRVLTTKRVAGDSWAPDCMLSRAGGDSRLPESMLVTHGRVRGGASCVSAEKKCHGIRVPQAGAGRWIRGGGFAKNGRRRPLQVVFFHIVPTSLPNLWI
jgi:hypothetical protein